MSDNQKAVRWEKDADGLVTMCAGGGMAPAIIIERV